MVEEFPLKILQGNRITLPKSYVDDLKLNVGDFIAYSYEGKKSIKIFPVRLEEK